MYPDNEISALNNVYETLKGIPGNRRGVKDRQKLYQRIVGGVNRCFEKRLWVMVTGMKESWNSFSPSKWHRC